jgi:CRISPR-associated exonuclease Cas4
MPPTQTHRTLTKVSELTYYLRCPRLVYFSSRGYEVPKRAEGNERSIIEHILWKELGLNWHKILGGVDEAGTAEGTAGGETVKRAIEEIVEGVEWIYKDVLEDVETELFETVKSDFLTGIANSEWLNNFRTETTVLAELEQSYGYEREHTAVSEKLGLVGSVDKLIRVGEVEFVPCMIKTGKCPEYGVWRSDRMQLAAYAMLIEEEFGTTVQRGFVEYIRTATVRELHIKKRDRALAFQILKHVKKIKSGAFPEKGANAPCDNCAFVDLCETKKTLLSKLLGCSNLRGAE